MFPPKDCCDNWHGLAQQSHTAYAEKAVLPVPTYRRGCVPWYDVLVCHAVLCQLHTGTSCVNGMAILVPALW